MDTDRLNGQTPAKTGEGARPMPSRLPESEDVPIPPTWKGDLLFAATAAVLLAVLVLSVFPNLLEGQLVDTDSYMRLVRVRQLAESGAWFDGTIPRSNAPFGETLHWTRPLDVLVLLTTWALSPIFGLQRSLHLSGVLLSPLLLVTICFATAWAVHPIAGAKVRYYSMISVLAQVGVMGYALPGRADHHMLILLAFVAMTGGAIRLFVEPAGHRSAWATGAWSAFGVWVSTEFLLPLGILLLALTVRWIAKGGQLATRARSLSVGLLSLTLLAVVLEHTPGTLLLVEYDRVSVVHSLAAALVTAFWTMAAMAGPRLGFRGRAVFVSFAGMLGAGIMFAVFPQFFGGPMVEVDPELKRSWLPFLTEYRPFLVPNDFSDIGRIFAYLGTALLAGGVVLHGLRRDRGTPLTDVWVLLGLELLTFVPLGIRWVRFVMYAEMVGVFGAIFLLRRSLDHLDQRSSGSRLGAIRGATAAGILAGPLLLGVVLMLATGESGSAARGAAATQTEACPVQDLIHALTDPSGLGSHPRTVLAHVDLGPVLLYLTPHSVIATPYHRNAQGILDSQRIFSATDPTTARRMISERKIDIVVSCGFAATTGEQGDSREPPFVALLFSGDTPTWLSRRSTTPSEADLGIFEVESLGGGQSR